MAENTPRKMASGPYQVQNVGMPALQETPRIIRKDENGVRLLNTPAVLFHHSHVTAGVQRLAKKCPVCRHRLEGISTPIENYSPPNEVDESDRADEEASASPTPTDEWPPGSY